ncbi:MAG: type 1 glutamine amidotransferase [Actinomycetota bacterium]|nr:type 1 glutamine amidotransferase [Actinomycetota bacterium]
MEPVVCVSHEPSVTPGIAVEVFGELGVPLRVMRAWEEVQWPAPDAMSGLVVLGGDMNADALDAYPFLKRVRALVSAAIGRGLPTLGICLGAQIMTRALGGVVRRSPRVELGFGPLDATDEGRRDPVFGVFADDVAVFQWHEDTFDLPPGATLLLRGGGLVQAFRYGPAAYAAQFHFEVTQADIAAWIEDTPPDRLQDYWGWSAEALLEAAHSQLPAQQHAGRDAFRRFAMLLAA